MDGQVYALESDGNWLYVGGAFTRINGHPQQRLAKVGVGSGNTDAAFRPNFNATVRVISLDASSIYVGGSLHRHQRFCPTSSGEVVFQWCSGQPVQAPPSPRRRDRLWAWLSMRTDRGCTARAGAAPTLSRPGTQIRVPRPGAIARWGTSRPWSSTRAPFTSASTKAFRATRKSGLSLQRLRQERSIRASGQPLTSSEESQPSTCLAMGWCWVTASPVSPVSGPGLGQVPRVWARPVGSQEGRSSG